jgi:flagellar basal-body rod protein FlgC
MRDILGIALSGLSANATRLGVSANNVANIATTGSADDPASAYQPQRAVPVSAGEGGGVRVTIQNTDPATVPAFSPGDPNANAEGMVALPNISLEQEVVEQMMAVTGYKANASVIKTLAAMDKALLDIKV